ncbi:hypothetical protein LC065_12410 [Halobacillus litoralis]|uniref:hypothetical protein n=1 Tax=Halobacillus litoralis TaxID=45668 RepID=UPI001CFE0BE6|nr:hypothetical protein [Halobacillus litoralis]WLR46383.1 hypothetical protein LC065_12410 [Halobacillus litoralis]
MRKLFIFMFGVFVLLAGCSSEKAKLMDEITSGVEGRYSVLAFKSEKDSVETFQNAINEMFSDPEVWETRLYSFNVLKSVPDQPYDYKKLLNIEELPQFIVLDTKAIVFRTPHIEELERFLLGEGDHSSQEH